MGLRGLEGRDCATDNGGLSTAMVVVAETLAVVVRGVLWKRKKEIRVWGFGITRSDIM